MGGATVARATMGLGRHSRSERGVGRVADGPRQEENEQHSFPLRPGGKHEQEHQNVRKRHPVLFGQGHTAPCTREWTTSHPSHIKKNTTFPISKSCQTTDPALFQPQPEVGVAKFMYRCRCALSTPKRHVARTRRPPAVVLPFCKDIYGRPFAGATELTLTQRSFPASHASAAVGRRFGHAIPQGRGPFTSGSQTAGFSRPSSCVRGWRDLRCAPNNLPETPPSFQCGCLDLQYPPIYSEGAHRAYSWPTGGA